MRVVITNTINEPQNCTLFSVYDRSLKAIWNRKDFFNFATDDGIEIYIDGDKDEEKRADFLKQLQGNFFPIKHIEFTSSSEEGGIFRYCTWDADGDLSVHNVITKLHVKEGQEYYPIIINDEKIVGIDFNTCFLLTLGSMQQIALDFIQEEAEEEKEEQPQ